MSKTSNPNPTVSKRLAAYSAVAAATAAGVSDARAAEVVWDITDILVTDDPAPGTIEAGVFFNMLTGATNAATANYDTPGTNYIFYDFTANQFRLDPRFGGYIYGPAYSGGAIGNLGFVGRIATSTSTTGGGAQNQNQLPVIDPTPPGAVSAGQNFVISPPFYSNFYAYLSFADGNKGTVGIRFDVSGNTHYGWAQVTRVDSDNFILHGFGYNDTPGAPSIAVDTDDSAITGDFDGDGDVDGVDIATMFANFNGPGGGVPGNPATDLDGDGDVDGVDIAQLFGVFTGPLGPASVPEPGSLALLALGAAGLATRRQRKDNA